MIGCQKTVLLRNIQYYCSNVQPRREVISIGEVDVITMLNVHVSAHEAHLETKNCWIFALIR
jgi:hypothetical protein